MKRSFPALIILLILHSMSMHSQEDSTRYYLTAGVDCYNSSDYPCAEMQLTKALKFAEKGGPQYLSEVYCNLGNTNAAQGNIETALTHYQDALRHTDKMKKGEHYRGKILSNVGALYEEQKNLEKALDYYDQAEKITRSVQDTFLLADILNNRGLVLEQQGHLPEAQKLYEEALVYYTQMNNAERLAICYNSLGIVTKQQQKLDEAIEYYSLAVEYARELGNEYFIAALTNNLGNVYALQKKYDEAISSSYHALSIARAINHMELVIECLGSLAEHYSAKGDYRTAYEYRTEFSTTHDSLLNTTRIDAMAEMETKFDVERKVLHIEKLETENQLREEENTRKKFFIGFLISLCTLIVLGSLLLFRINYLRQKKRELEMVAQAEKQERDRIAQDLHDELGSGISRINWITGSAQRETTNVESKEKFARVETIAQQLSSNMKSLIWLLYSGNVELGALLGRIRELVNQHADDFNFHAHIEFPSGGHETPIRQNAAKDIFLLIKECITNISKHASASEVAISISDLTHNVIIIVSDNGKGFDLQTVERGHGLNNLFKRVESMHGNAKVDSSDSGSEFIFTIPTRDILA